VISLGPFRCPGDVVLDPVTLALHGERGRSSDRTARGAGGGLQPVAAGRPSEWSRSAAERFYAGQSTVRHSQASRRRDRITCRITDRPSAVSSARHRRGARRAPPRSRRGRRRSRRTRRRRSTRPLVGRARADDRAGHAGQLSTQATATAATVECGARNGAQAIAQCQVRLQRGGAKWVKSMCQRRQSRLSISASRSAENVSVSRPACSGL